MGTGEAEYFVNHDRRDRFPWSLYHGALTRGLVSAIALHGERPRVLVVGCGLEPTLSGVPSGTIFHACDLDARAIETCRARFPEMADRLAVCPDPLTLPTTGAFAEPFDAVVAKEVVEHLPSPEPWARALAACVRIGGDLLLTTPNYGRDSTLDLLERTVLEWVARRDGYSRAHIHPTRFDRARLHALDVGPGMARPEITIPWHRWALLGRWRRVGPAA